VVTLYKTLEKLVKIQRK